MNIVTISEKIPTLNKKGSQLIAYNRLIYLTKLANKIELVCFQSKNKKDDIKAKINLEKKGIKIHFIKMNFLEILFNFLKSLLFSNLPSQCAVFKSNKFQNKIKEILNQSDIDLIYCVTIRVAPNITWYKGKLFIELIDSIGLNFFYRYLKSKGLKKFFLYNEYKKVSKYEKNLADQSTCSFVVSNIDKNKISSKKVKVIANGVRLSNIRRSKSKKNIIIFSGNMFYQPNIEAVMWFVENCWIKILKEEPKTKFLIVGNDPKPNIVSLEKKYPSIKVTGNVPSIFDVIKLASVAIAPMQSGSGMQNKILEAMACSVPVVTTSKGLGDIKAINKRDIIIADKAGKFSSSVLHLLQSKQKNKLIGINGKKFVLQNHNWERLNNKFLKYISSK